MAIIPEEHPWQGFAHPDHRPEDFEPLFRHLRYTLIHLKKLWVAIQSCPVFLNSVVDQGSVTEVEQILTWFQKAPNWYETLSHPKAIPELADPASKERLIKFVTDLKSTRVLLEKIQSRLSGAPSSKALSHVVQLAANHASPSWNLSNLDQAIADLEGAFAAVNQVISFLEDCASRFGSPLPANKSEFQSLLRAFEWIQEMPEKIWPWRLKSTTATGQGIRIQAWQDRARPLLEMRRKLNAKFYIHEVQETGVLNRISDGLKASSWFYAFTRTYRMALKEYRKLRRPRANDQKIPRESRLEMIEGINEWILFLEQNQAFDKNQEVKQIFGSLFKGIDTDFTSALEAYFWATRLREEFVGHKSQDFKFTEQTPNRLGEFLAGFVIQIPEAQILEIDDLMKSSELKRLEKLLEDPELASGRKFSDLRLQREQRLLVLKELRSTLQSLGLRQDVRFSELEELMNLYEDLSFVQKQVEKSVESSTYLKNNYQGTDTDLLSIEQAAGYVGFIESAPIPVELKKPLLTTSGPQRLADTQGLIPQCLFSLATVQNYLVRLEAMTYGQVRTLAGKKSIRSIPVPRLIERIQRALDHSQDMDAWVSHLRFEREAKRSATGVSDRNYGLAQDLDSREFSGTFEGDLREPLR